jgi:hypothetical protein
MPWGNGDSKALLYMAAVCGLAYVVFLALGAAPGLVLPALVMFWLVWFLFAGFHTWRLRPGTATITYGWGRLAKLGFKRVSVDVTSVLYELEAWDNGAGAWHNVKLVSSGREPQLIVSRTSNGALRNQLPISSSADLNLTQEVVAVAQLFAEALAVPSRVVTYVVRSPDPWWARGE